LRKKILFYRFFPFPKNTIKTTQAGSAFVDQFELQQNHVELCSNQGYGVQFALVTCARCGTDVTILFGPKSKPFLIHQPQQRVTHHSKHTTDTTPGERIQTGALHATAGRQTRCKFDHRGAN